MGTDDNLPIDGIPLDELERAKNEFKFETKLQAALDYIRKELPIKGFADLLSEDLWLREVMKDLEGSKCRSCKKSYSTARSKALQLYGEWLGMIGNKAKKKSRREVSFEQSEASHGNVPARG